jgi:folate/biopterin transporter
LILWQATPSAGSALFYFEVNELGFQPEFLGRLGLVSSLSSLIGILIYNQKLKSVPLRTIFKWTCITGTVLGMTPLILVTHLNRQFGLSDKWFAIGDDIILTVLGQIAFMPILVLAAKLCPSGVEAMLYASLMSINNLSGVVAGLLGSTLTKFVGITEHNFENLPFLIIITNITGLIPLAFLKFLPEENKNNKNNQNNHDE